MNVQEHQLRELEYLRGLTRLLQAENAALLLQRERATGGSGQPNQPIALGHKSAVYASTPGHVMLPDNVAYACEAANR